MPYIGKQEMCMHENNMGNRKQSFTLRWFEYTNTHLHVHCCNLIDSGSTHELKMLETEEI